jgi:hypothetical protein
MTFTFKDNTLFLTLRNIDLSLRIKKLLAPVSFRFHLQLKLSLDLAVCRLKGLYLEARAFNSPILRNSVVRNDGYQISAQ